MAGLARRTGARRSPRTRASASKAARRGRGRAAGAARRERGRRATRSRAATTDYEAKFGWIFLICATGKSADGDACRPERAHAE
jgi:hypothetical protein